LCQLKHQVYKISTNPLQVPRLIILFILVGVFINVHSAASVTGFHSYLPDTVKIDTIKKQNPLKSELFYKAKDSIRFEMENQVVYLFGMAEVNYDGTRLTADYIEYNFKEGTVFATYTLDSAGNPKGKPGFDDGQQALTASEIRYNFKTKKGLIKEVRTQQGEGYIHMDISKRHPDEEVHLSGGKYTTCNLDHPHYYFKLRKAIVIPDDKIISGPVNLVIADMPTPLALPFGFFPNKKRESKGIIIPQYGESQQLGFYLINGGYYFPVGKKVDMQLLGDIYSRGSWGAKNITRYINRYHNKGTVNLSFNEMKRSDKDFPDYSVTRSFFVRWQHEQDAKAHPYRRFSANVNAGTTNNFQNNFNTYSQDYLSNLFQSNISFSYLIPNKPFNLSVNLRHNQSTQTKLINFTLPEFAFNVTRFYPFGKWKTKTNAVAKALGNIGVSYSTNAKYDISVPDSLVSLDNLDTLAHFSRSGIKHNASTTTSFKLLKQRFTFNPAFNFSERWYLQTLNKYWDNDLQQTVTDTLNGFKRAHEYNLSASLTTKLFGMYSFKGKRNTKIRHVLTPVVNFTYRPDFGTQQYGYYDNNPGIDSYSPFDLGIYGKPSSNESGLVTMSLVNNLEMKMKSKKDTVTGYRKIILLENFTFNSSCDLFKDSLNLSNIILSARTKLWKNVNIVYNGILDPYNYNNGIITNDLAISEGKGAGRLTVNDFNLNCNIKSKKKKTPEKPVAGDEDEMEEINRNPDSYVDFNLPWSLALNYKVRTTRSFINTVDTTIITQALGATGDFLLTKNWKIGFIANYDFTLEDFSYVELNIYRDLHCWEMRFNWIPFGFRKSYMIQINIKSSLLQDLKLMRRRSWVDTI